MLIPFPPLRPADTPTFAPGRLAVAISEHLEGVEQAPASWGLGLHDASLSMRFLCGYAEYRAILHAFRQSLSGRLGLSLPAVIAADFSDEAFRNRVLAIGTPYDWVFKSGEPPAALRVSDRFYEVPVELAGEILGN